MEVFDLSVRRFRANADYELVLYDRLADHERQALVELSDDPKFYGILRPRPGTGYSIKQVGPDTALLFLTLKDPGLVPTYLRARLGEDCDRSVAQLVLDGVLEVESGDSFVSGSRAYQEVLTPPPSVVGSGRIARLSVQALRHAEELEGSHLAEPVRLAQKLYLYNHLPYSPRWRRYLHRQPGMREFLQLENGGLPGDLPGSRWRMSDPTPEHPWLSGQATTAGPFGGTSSYVWKLYVSPWPDEVPVAFHETLKVLPGLGAVSFKVAGDPAELLRSDKMVVYFREFGKMTEAGRRIAHALEGIRPHGVPFTAEVEGSNGLVSWGVDYPSGEKRLFWQTPESWRVWVTQRLAVSLISALNAESGTMKPWQFALSRLHFEGIDPETWAPLEAVERSSPSPRGRS